MTILKAPPSFDSLSNFPVQSSIPLPTDFSTPISNSKPHHVTLGASIFCLYAAVRNAIDFLLEIHVARRGNDYNIIIYLVIRDTSAVRAFFE